MTVSAASRQACVPEHQTEDDSGRVRAQSVVGESPPSRCQAADIVLESIAASRIALRSPRRVAVAPASVVKMPLRHSGSSAGGASAKVISSQPSTGAQPWRWRAMSLAFASASGRNRGSTAYRRGCGHRADYDPPKRVALMPVPTSSARRLPWPRSRANAAPANTPAIAGRSRSLSARLDNALGPVMLRLI